MGNREALLEAAVVCLRERGYGHTTARDVAGTAQVSLGAIRYHFGSMDGLLNTAIGECCSRWIAGFRRVLAETSPQASVLAEMDQLYQFFEEDRELLVGFVEAFAHAQRSAQAREQLAALYDEFRAGVAEAIRSALGDHRAADHASASVLIALVDGLMVQWLLDPTRRPDRDTLHRLVGGMVAGMAPP